METFERNGYTIAKFDDGNVAIKTPDEKYFAALPADFVDTTLVKHFEEMYQCPLQTILKLADCVQYHPDLLYAFRETIMKHFVPRVLAPIQHIHHNRLAVKSLNFWNPLTPWENTQTQFSRVCIDPQSARVFGDMLKYKSTPMDGNNIVAKYKKFVPEIKAALEDGNPLVFANAWDSLTFTADSEMTVTKTFLPRPVAEVGEEKNTAYRLLCEYNEEEAPWAKSIMYAMAVYVFSDFCFDPRGEQEAFYEIAGEQAEAYLQGMWDHHLVNKDRFKEYEAENKYTNQNDVAFDYATPTVAKSAQDFTLTVELEEFKYPAQRQAEAEKKAAKEAAKAAATDPEAVMVGGSPAPE